MVLPYSRRREGLQHSRVVPVAVAEPVSVISVFGAVRPVVGAPQVVPELVRVGEVVDACGVNHRESVVWVIHEKVPAQFCNCRGERISAPVSVSLCGGFR